jgi:hypothetical protein
MSGKGVDTLFHTVATAHNDALRRGVLNVWTVYDHPKDFPDTYVARRFEVGRSAELGPSESVSPRRTDDIVQGELQIIRESFKHCGLTCFIRNEGDDPNIVESWL